MRRQWFRRCLSLVAYFPVDRRRPHETSFVGPVIAGVGVFTAFMAATMAVAQDDVKGVLAYSTISQLGFMVAAIGMVRTLLLPSI